MNSKLMKQLLKIITIVIIITCFVYFVSIPLQRMWLKYVIGIGIDNKESTIQIPVSTIPNNLEPKPIKIPLYKEGKLVQVIEASELIYIKDKPLIIRNIKIQNIKGDKLISEVNAEIAEVMIGDGIMDFEKITLQGKMCAKKYE